MSISQFSVIQLISFLERRSFKDFANIQGFRKVMAALDQLKNDLGNYYEEYVKLELDHALLVNPYVRKANELRTEYAEDEATLTKELNKLQTKADKDTKLIESFGALQAFKKAEDGTIIEIDIKNPDQKIAVKSLFESFALESDGWASKNVVADLSEFLGV